MVELGIIIIVPLALKCQEPNKSKRSGGFMNNDWISPDLRFYKNMIDLAATCGTGSLISHDLS